MKPDAHRIISLHILGLMNKEIVKKTGINFRRVSAVLFQAKKKSVYIKEMKMQAGLVRNAERLQERGCCDSFYW